MTKRLLFAAVGEPVIHPDLRYQVGTKASELGGGHAPLDTLRPEGGGTYFEAEGAGVIPHDFINGPQCFGL